MIPNLLLSLPAKSLRLPTRYIDISSEWALIFLVSIFLPVGAGSSPSANCLLADAADAERSALSPHRLLYQYPRTSEANRCTVR